MTQTEQKQVNGMTSQKTITQLALMLFTLALSNVLFAEEYVKNAHKDNRAGNTISHADTTGHVDRYLSSAVRAKTNVSTQQKVNNDILTLKQMRERHREKQEAQLEAFKHYLQERRQQSAAFNKTQQKAYVKLMEERRVIMKKMMEQQRQAAEQRRKTMLLKMHQTSTTPASDNAERRNRA